MILVAGDPLAGLVDPGSDHAPGGSPATVALALARLGQPVTLLSRAGDRYADPIGDDLAESGVAMCPGRAPHRLPRRAVAVHAGALALGLAPEGADLEERLAEIRAGGTATVTIDLNLRRSLAGEVGAVRERIERQIGLAHVVKTSEAVLAWLYPGVPASAVLSWWRRAGVSCGIVTHGGAGAYLLAPNGVAYRRTAFRRPALHLVIEAVRASAASLGLGTESALP